MIHYLLLGAVVGAALTGMMWWIDRDVFLAYLVRKAQPQKRAPVIIEGKPYFVVPAREFVAMKARAIRPHSYLSDTGD